MASEEEVCVEIGSNIDDSWVVEKADISKLCRACANSNENMIPIFEGDGLEHDLESKIDKHLPVKISKEDGLPHQMCFQCASTLVAWHDMFTGCVEAEKKLNQLIVSKVNDDRVEEEETVDETFDSFNPESEEDMAIDKFTSDIQARKQTGVVLEAEEVMAENEADDNEGDDNEADDNEAEDNEDLATVQKSDGSSKEKKGEFGPESQATIRDQCYSKSHYLKDNVEITRCSVSKDHEQSPAQLDRVNAEIRGLKSSILSYKLISERDQGSRSDFNGSDRRVACKKRQESRVECLSEDNVSFDCVERENEVGSEGSGQGPFCCHVCGKVLKTKRNFIRHCKMHTGDRLFPCSQCGKRFYERGNVLRHIREVHECIKQFACDLCKKAFASRSTLNDHRRTHTGERPYACSTCGKTFKTASALHLHCVLHSNNFWHVCDVCNKRFKRKSELVVHVRKHTGEKPVICDKCGKAFRVICDLSRHLAVHSNEKPFKCDKCGSMFGQKRYLRKHLKLNNCQNRENSLTKIENELRRNFPLANCNKE